MEVIARRKARPRQEFLRRRRPDEGIYVPSLYDVDYNEDGTVKID